MPYCFAESPSFFRSKSKNWIKKQIFKVIFPIYFSLHNDWWFDIPDLTVLQKDKEITETPKLITEKENFFRKRNLFSSKFFSGSANFWWLNPEKNFLTEIPIFFHLKVRRSLKSCSLSKNNVFPQNLAKIRRLQFWKPCREFFAYSQKKSLKILRKLIL